MVRWTALVATAALFQGATAVSMESLARMVSGQKAQDEQGGWTEWAYSNAGEEGYKIKGQHYKDAVGVAHHACSERDSFGSEVVVRMTMGSVVDYYKPKPGNTLCSMLTSNANHLWASNLQGPWFELTPATNMLGGGKLTSDALKARLPNDKRQEVSGWGSDFSANKGAFGTTSYDGTPAWRQTFKMAVAPAPVDCEVSAWGAFGECKAECWDLSKGDDGKPTKLRTRTVSKQAANGGKACPALEQIESCNSNPCPAPCQVGAFAEWGQCSKECGGGTRSRSREVTQQEVANGGKCPALTETEACNIDACPADCKVGKWGEYGECSKECGGGWQTRTREVTQEQVGTGKQCPKLKKGRKCNPQPCPVDCQLSDWKAWGECDAMCGGGTRTANRDVIVQNSGSGAVCGSLQKEEPCNTQPCPIDCELKPWGEWGKCSSECGGGMRTRKRDVDQQPLYGGKPCDSVMEQEPCGEKPCPVDCEVSEWAAWSECSAKCGDGTQSRTRTSTVDAAHGGEGCPPLSEDRKCPNLQPCPIDCQLSEFSEWTPCSKECGGGESRRSQKILTKAAHDGKPCPASLEEVRLCNAEACVTDLDRLEKKIRVLELKHRTGELEKKKAAAEGEGEGEGEQQQQQPVDALEPAPEVKANVAGVEEEGEQEGKDAAGAQAGAADADADAAGPADAASQDGSDKTDKTDQGQNPALAPAVQAGQAVEQPQAQAQAGAQDVALKPLAAAAATAATAEQGQALPNGQHPAISAMDADKILAYPLKSASVEAGVPLAADHLGGQQLQVGDGANGKLGGPQPQVGDGANGKDPWLSKLVATAADAAQMHADAAGKLTEVISQATAGRGSFLSVEEQESDRAAEQAVREEIARQERALAHGKRW